MQLIAGTAAAFTLFCSGTQTNVNSGVSEPYAVSYGVDLDRGIWCEDPCRTPSDLVSATGGTLTLRDGAVPRSRIGTLWRITIDRRTGAHLERRVTTATVVIMGTERRGQCREASSARVPAAVG
jgi:hypothetical protein